MKTVSAIIPCYNEGEYVINLVKTLKDSNIFKEIILVDDKSKPEFAKIYDQIKNITVIHKDINEGKDFALKTGIERTTSDYIAIFDADLKGVTVNHLQRIKEYINNELDIIYLIRGNDIKIAKILGNTYITVGEHIIKRDIVNEYADILFSKEEWSFDNEINNISYKTNKYKVKFLELQNVNHVMKSKKYSFIKGLLLDLKMIYKVLIVKYKIIGYITTYINAYRYIKNRDIIPD